MVIQQNENADTALVFKWIQPDGLCASLFRMLYFFALCQRKGYYFVLDDQNFSVIPYTDVFKPFWSEETNRSVLESAKQIHLFGHSPDEGGGVEEVGKGEATITLSTAIASGMIVF